jgi:tripartite-type tricarboxylate transporter receptor subunit TctC
MEELGYPGFISNVWYCLLAPANTPAPVIEKIRADVLRAASDPETLGKLKKLGIQVAGTTPDDSRAILASETQKWGDLIRAVGVTAE